MNKYLIYNIDKKEFALEINSIDRVIHSIYVTPLPDAPEQVIGIINLFGEIIPVINMRKQFNIINKQIEIRDQFIIAHTTKQKYALAVDSVKGIYEWNEHEISKAEKSITESEHVKGVMKLNGNIVVISKLEDILTGNEANILKEEINEHYTSNNK